MEILWVLVPAAENHDARRFHPPGDPPLSDSYVFPQRWTDMMDLVPRPGSISYASTGPGKATFQSSTGLKYHRFLILRASSSPAWPVRAVGGGLQRAVKTLQMVAKKW